MNHPNFKWITVLTDDELQSQLGMSVARLNEITEWKDTTRTLLEQRIITEQDAIKEFDYYFQNFTVPEAELKNAIKEEIARRKK